mmetsp:Transcript_30951/g.64911  ORF Transcript_30951/g.64911 Transcript_30951/m.64911 type:complete len:193 (-) Transcript_30951:196-774(-)
MGQVLPRLSQLTDLDLGHNRLGPEGAAKLCEGLSSLTALTNLNFCGNNLWTDGASSFGQAVTALTCLKSLNLGSNSMGPRAVTALAPSLTTLLSLETLNLRQGLLGAPAWSAEPMGEAGAAVLAAALARLPRLRALDAACNGLGSAGVLLLSLDGGARLSRLEELVLVENDADEKSLEAARAALIAVASLQL